MSLIITKSFHFVSLIFDDRYDKSNALPATKHFICTFLFVRFASEFIHRQKRFSAPIYKAQRPGYQFSRVLETFESESTGKTNSKRELGVKKIVYKL